MGTLDLTSDYSGNKIQIRKDLIIAMETLEDAAVLSRNKTRVYLKGGKFKDVLEAIADIRRLIQ